MNFRWKQSSIQKETASSPRKATTKSSTPEKRNFKFIQGQSAQRRKKPWLPKGQTSAGLFNKFRLDVEVNAAQAGESANGGSEDYSDPSIEEVDRATASKAVTSNSVESQPTTATTSPAPSASSQLPDIEFPASDFDLQVSRASSLQLHPYLRQTHPNDQNETYTFDTAPLHSLSNGVMFRSLAHKYSAMFSMFNEEFCIVPLSTDCLHNPFRAREDFAESYTFLSHAVMALTSHHLSKNRNSSILQRETQNHWSTALQLLSTALTHTGILPLLDTILLLINFESTQSAFGMLNMHLTGARRLLEQPGAMDTFARSSRMRAQVAMLVWWDVTSALTARRHPRLADPHLSLLQGFDESDGWSFLTLAGCPVEFVVAMARLAGLACSHEAGNDCAGEVQAILDEVRDYLYMEKTSDPQSGLVTSDPNTTLNRLYCIQAWRHALPLYALRIFHQPLSGKDLSRIQHHARLILDNARCIPPTEPFQKQVLLPVFLAGAEVGDDFNRSFVRGYCEHWSRTCNFDQFSGALALLEGIWEGWRGHDRGEWWWGVKVGGGSEDESGGEGLRKELLLG